MSSGNEGWIGVDRELEGESSFLQGIAYHRPSGRRDLDAFKNPKKANVAGEQRAKGQL